jgi:hypothetical protein
MDMIPQLLGLVLAFNAVGVLFQALNAKIVGHHPQGHDQNVVAITFTTSQFFGLTVDGLNRIVNNFDIFTPKYLS